jgi:hypothetical protein
MFRTVKKLECIRHVRHVYPQAQLGGALPEGSSSWSSRSQADAGQSVDGFAEANALLAAEALGRGRYVVIEPDCGTHAARLSPVMRVAAHQ